MIATNQSQALVLVWKKSYVGQRSRPSGRRCQIRAQRSCYRPKWPVATLRPEKGKRGVRCAPWRTALPVAAGDSGTERRGRKAMGLRSSWSGGEGPTRPAQVRAGCDQDRQAAEGSPGPCHDGQVAAHHGDGVGG
jgi:hypothetical protein